MWCYRRMSQLSNYTVSNKNVTTLSRHNSDIQELIWIIFGKNVTEKAGNQKILNFPISPN